MGLPGAGVWPGAHVASTYAKQVVHEEVLVQYTLQAKDGAWLILDEWKQMSPCNSDARPTLFLVTARMSHVTRSLVVIVWPFLQDCSCDWCVMYVWIIALCSDVTSL